MNRFFLLFLSLIASLPAIYGVLFTPALPQVAADFAISPQVAQFSMTVFICGYALGQLPYGPLANRFGRKPILCAGITCAIGGCLLSIYAIYSLSFSLLLFSRFFMAVGACSGLNIAYTMVGDLYDQKRTSEVLAIMMLISALIPGIATCIGGTIVHYFPWSFCFYFLALFGIIILIFFRKFPETCSHLDPTALKIVKIINNYKIEIRNPLLVLSAVITGCGSGIIYLFASMAPFIAITIIGMSSEEYGRSSLIPSIGLLTGAIIMRLVVSIFSLTKILMMSVFLLLASSAVMLSFFVVGTLTFWSLYLPTFFIFLSLSILFATTATIALSYAKNKSFGSSLVSFINLSFCVITVFSNSFFPYQASMLPILFLALSCSIFFLSTILLSFLKIFITGPSYDNYS